MNRKKATFISRIHSLCNSQDVLKIASSVKIQMHARSAKKASELTRDFAFRVSKIAAHAKTENVKFASKDSL